MADKVEKAKKRKRQIDGTSKPSKRVAIEDDQQIKFSVRETGKWAPIIGMQPSFKPEAGFRFGIKFFIY